MKNKIYIINIIMNSILIITYYFILFNIFINCKNYNVSEIDICKFMRYLITYDFLNNKTIRKSILKMQKYYKLNRTGEINDDVLSLINISVEPIE